MRNFLIINFKALTIEAVLQNAHDGLNKIAADPETSHLEIFSASFINTFEMPPKQSIMSTTPLQPVMVINCTVILQAPTVSQLPGMAVVDPEHRPPSTDLLSDEDKKEIERIKEVNKMKCQHTRLMPGRYTKGYRDPGKYYQVCADCQAEVWQEVTQQEIDNDLAKKMRIVPADIFEPGGGE